MSVYFSKDKEQNYTFKRFFSDSSFWNQPLPEMPEIDPNSERWISLLKSDPSGLNVIININEWTIPVYEINDSTPKYKINFHYLSDEEKTNWATKREHFGHGPGFGPEVPIPDHALPDPESDAHFAVIDREKNDCLGYVGVQKKSRWFMGIEYRNEI
ncbi:MAG: hypothetical protein HC906_09915 [Bacteroidales bacterium]|nr:hypothetical protein [Bacteroidales bacterium]